MHQDLLAEYIQTEEFARAAGKGFGILMAEAIEGACQQMGGPEQRSKLNSKQILAQMHLAKVNAGLGIKPNKPVNWWIPPMEKAARVLIESNEGDPDLPAGCPYDLPYLRTLTAERLEEIGRKRVVPVGSDLSEGAMKAIYDVCGSEEIPAEGAVGLKDQDEVTSAVRVDAHPPGQDDVQARPSQS